jgi:predicted regulator of Ras-like GTPase activity (Roadblock/LC7/MglB family)
MPTDAIRPGTHWLADQLAELQQLANPTTSAEHEEFQIALHTLVEEVSQRRGVSSCVVGHEGFVVATAGRLVDAERLAAMSQLCLATGTHADEELGLGGLQQMLLVGGRMKVVLFQVGEMSIAIHAETGVDLGATLAEYTPVSRTHGRSS